LTYILDACALITLFKTEPGEDLIRRLIKQAEAGETLVSMSVINLMEVHYGFINDLGRDKALVILERISKMPIRIIETISTTVFHEASRLKSSYKCAIADAIGLATAKEFSATFVTSDHSELEAVEKSEPIPFLWLPPRPKKETVRG
jgi:predicted nucleic acid-binding protein